MATTMERPAQADPQPAPVVSRSPGQVWWRVYRHHLRLLRNSAIAWTVALAGIAAGVAATFEDRYSTEAELQSLREMEGIPAFEALLGRYVEPATVEGLVLSRWGMFGILVAVWGILAVGRLLRGAEEAGHVEPLRAGMITPRGLFTAATAAMVTVFGLFAVVVGATHSAAGMDPATSWATGAAMGLLGATFAAAGALASQLVASRRGAVGLVGGVLGLALGSRVVAAASGTPEWVWWTSPMGWIGFLHETDRARTAVFVAFVVVLAALVAAGLVLARRDLHGGLVRGAEVDTGRTWRPVRGHPGLAARLAAAPARTWGVIVGVVALVFGLLAHDFAAAAGDLPTTVELAAQLGWAEIDTPEGVLGWTFSIIALLLAVFAAGQAAAVRDEEASWRIEHLLARPVGRTQWLGVRVLVSATAVLVVGFVAGLAAWAGTAVAGVPVAVTDALLAALNVVPVAWLALGVGIALFGLFPRLTAPLAYGLVLAAYLLDFVGGMLDLPGAVLDLSPFRQLAAVPVEGIDTAPTLVMLVVGLLGVLVGLAALRRRDLREA